MDKDFDVAVVGAGYAGLACALLLGRYRLRTAVFDGGKTRNAATRRVHGYPGFESSSPAALLARVRQDAGQYKSVTFLKKAVEHVAAKKGGKGFSINAGSNTNYNNNSSNSSRSYSARYVVLATGVQDIKPEIAGFDRFDGDGAWHCPHCDGPETAGKRLALIVAGRKKLEYAREFLGWTSDITIFLHDSRIDRQELEEAEELGIEVIDDTVTEMSGRKGRGVKRLTCASGRRHFTDLVFYRLGYVVQNRLATEIGCRLDDDGYVRVDGEQRTSVPGVYAAGDIDTDRHFVVLAAAAGVRAAISIYEDVVKNGGKKRRKSA
ncbi:NAD(P)/FAD-dependent oxidoreductase [Nitrososphaera sp.]|uniref:NAD(P)/FAD-dependent oxidoreductase n=1 Tax=Nitrososphaera sp. TaxID=1971748 RepID=UPI00307E05FF